MKHLKDIFRTLCLFSACLCCATARAETPDSGESLTPAFWEHLDSTVELSLVTCSPHEEIYSLYGHTALRCRNLETGTDLVYNWGVFNFHAPHFVVRFVFGLTDYELGITDFDGFCKYYAKWGSSVTEQVLNLTPEEKLNVLSALADNYRPGNRIYRYNFFYDNCSTRPRNIIEQSLNGRLEYAKNQYISESWRDAVHRCVRNHPWARFGNDALLGFKADATASQRELEFLPENLMHDIGEAQVLGADGYRPLVKEVRVAVRPGVQIIERDFILTPTACALLLLAVSLVIVLLEWRRKKTFVWWDVALMAVSGLTGTLLFVMLFSQHPATSTNLQVLLLNPLPLFFVYQVARRRKTLWWKLSFVLIVLFLAGGFLQHYAEGMYIVASCLLLRTLINHR